MKKVLLIDDDKVLTRHYEEALGVQGFQVDVCSSVSDIMCLALSSYDLIVCDLMMPNDGFFANVGTNRNLITGLRVAEHIRGDPCDVPIVLLTNLNIDSVLDDVERSIEPLTDVVLMKKYDFNPVEFSQVALSLINREMAEYLPPALGRRLADSIIVRAPIIPGFVTLDLLKLFGKKK